MRGGNNRKKQATETGDPPLSAAKPPSDLTPAARKIWKQTLDRVTSAGGQIPSRFEPILAGYCEASVTASEAATQIRKEGLTIVDRRGTPVKHPCVSVQTQALAQLRGYAETLGLTPASAARLPLPEKSDRNEFADLLNS